MIEFKFTLSEEDAENLFGLINDEINRTNFMIIEEMTGEDREEYIDFHRHWIKYYKELKTKLLHKKVNA